MKKSIENFFETELKLLCYTPCMSDTGVVIRDSFLSLYEEESFEMMTVSSLCRKAHIARTTFYEYYTSLADVKSEIEDELIGGILSLAAECRRTGCDMATFFSRTLEYVSQQRSINYLFLVERPNSSFITKWKNAIKEHFSSYHPAKGNTANYSLVLEVIASAVLGAYTYWMEHPAEVDTSKLTDISLRMLETLEAEI